jgi:MoaA/NifB/PqqE/SkfB family radical SAM enzyme
MGEPLLHPRFFEILKYSIDSGINTNVITNFSLIPQKISIKQILTAGIGTLCLSYQTPNERTFEIRRTKITFKEYFNKLKEILLFANNNKINTSRVEIHILQSLYNYLNVEIVKDYSLIESAIVKLNNILCSNSSNTINPYCDKGAIAKAVKTFQRGKQYLDTFEIELAPQIYVELKRANTWANCLLPEGCEVEPEKKNHCGFFNSSLGILWDGRCTVCCQDFNGSILIGDAKSNSIREILNGEILYNLQEMERKGRLINSYCQVCKGTIKKGSHKISIIKNQGIINKGFNCAHRVRTKLVNSLSMGKP